MNLNKYIFLLITLLLVGSLSAQPAFSVDMVPSETSLEVQDAYEAASLNETFMVDVIGTGLANATSVYFIIKYDPAQLKYEGFDQDNGDNDVDNVLKNGCNLTPLINEDEVSGTIEVNLSQQDVGCEVNGDGLIGNLEFESLLGWGESAEITIEEGKTVNNLYVTTNLTEDNLNLGTYSIGLPQFSLTVGTSGTGAGTTTPTGAVTVGYNVATVCTATPDVSSTFATWAVVSGDANISNLSSLTLTDLSISPALTGDAEISAVCNIKQFTLSVDNDGDGTVDETPTVNYGVATDIAAATVVGKTFTGWTVTTGAATLADASLATTTATLIDGNATVTANFAVNTYTITVTSGANGTITPAGPITLNHGENSPVLTIAPAANYQIVNVLVDGVSKGAVGTHQFTGVTANHTISATFSQVVHNITVTQTANGTITPAGDASGIVATAQGSDQTFTIAPAANYQIATLVVDGSPVTVASTYTFTNVSAAHTITATFTPIMHIIYVTQSANGSIAPAGDAQARVDVAQGADATFTITPEAGYEIVSLVIDGTPIAAAATYTFASVMESHTITATFDQISDIQSIIRIPETFSLSSARNKITYGIPKDAQCDVTVALYTLNGQLVKSVAHGNSAAGYYSIDLQSGNYRLGNGIYICTLQSRKFSQTVKVSVK